MHIFAAAHCQQAKNKPILENHNNRSTGMATIMCWNKFIQCALMFSSSFYSHLKESWLIKLDRLTEEPDRHSNRGSFCIFLDPRHRIWELALCPTFWVYKTIFSFSHVHWRNEKVTRQSHSMRMLLAFFSGSKESVKIISQNLYKNYPVGGDQCSWYPQCYYNLPIGHTYATSVNVESA